MAKILKIITNPNPLLRKKSKEVAVQELSSMDFKRFCSSLANTMVKKDGVGLAAPQVGKNIRVFAINTKDGPEIVINPKIIKKSLSKDWSEEGCLSVPNYFGEVKRHKRIVCEYVNKEGVRQKVDANGLMAIVMQHENDHLDGILFIDKAKNIQKMD